MNQVIEYNKTEQGLSELRDEFSGVIFEVATAKGMESAKQARAKIRSLRVDLEAMRKEIKAPALERCRLIDAEAARITGELKLLETPIDEQIKIEENRKKEEKEARERAEKLRIEGLHAKINEIKGYVAIALKSSSSAVKLFINELEGSSINEEEFQELFKQAVYEKEIVLGQLKEILSTKKSEEAHIERIAQLERDMEAQRIILEEQVKERQKEIKIQKQLLIEREEATERVRLEREYEVQAQFEELKKTNEALIKEQELSKLEITEEDYAVESMGQYNIGDLKSISSLDMFLTSGFGSYIGYMLGMKDSIDLTFANEYLAKIRDCEDGELYHYSIDFIVKNK